MNKSLILSGTQKMLIIMTLIALVCIWLFPPQRQDKRIAYTMKDEARLYQVGTAPDIARAIGLSLVVTSISGILFFLSLGKKEPKRTTKRGK
jgi:hypothetical protein